MGGIYSSLDQFSGITTLPVPVSDGGTGRSSLTDGAVLVGDGTNPVGLVGPLTDGQLLIGDTAGVDPVAASLTAPAAGITITGGAGSITFALSDDLLALENLATTGIAARTAADTWALRTITGTANEVTVTNGDGVAGDPTLSLPSNIYVDGISFDGGSNILDFYEEGTFTPTVIGSGTAGTATYSTQIGNYTRIGREVFFRIILVWTGGTGTGNLLVTGLPYTVNANNGNAPISLGFPSTITIAAGTNQVYAFVVANSTNIAFTEIDFNTSNTSLPYDAAGTITLTGNYYV